MNSKNHTRPMDIVMAVTLWSLSRDRLCKMEEEDRRKLEEAIEEAGGTPIEELRKALSEELGKPITENWVSGLLGW